MEHRSPTPDALSELLRAAQAYQADHPWEHVDDDQPFGVRDPRTNHVILARIHGRSGIHFGLCAYPGLEGWITLQRSLHRLIPSVRLHALHEMRSMLCAFVPLRELEPEDRDLLRDGGWSGRADQRMPRFRSFVPGFLPWRLDANEVRQMTWILQESLHVARDAASSPDLFGSGPAYEYLTRQSKWAGETYVWAPPDVFAERPKQVSQLDELTAARLARLSVHDDEEWEAALTECEEAVRPTPEHRPELLFNYFVLDHADGYLHFGDRFTASTALGSIPRALAEVLLNVGYAPRRILVNNFMQRAVIAPLAKIAGSKLQKVQRLPWVERAHESLSEFQARGR